MKYSTAVRMLKELSRFRTRLNSLANFAQKILKAREYCTGKSRMSLSTPNHEIVRVRSGREGEKDRQDCYNVRINVFHHEQGFPLDAVIDELRLVLQLAPPRPSGIGYRLHLLAQARRDGRALLAPPCALSSTDWDSPRVQSFLWWRSLLQTGSSRRSQRFPQTKLWS
jgi:hypothetical protein